MKINSKIRYGLRTLIEIAKSDDPNGVLQKDIASSQSISLKYLDPIIAALKVKGLISNSKGRGSGYVLIKDPKEITMLDVYTAFEQIVMVECINNKSICEQATHDCKAKNYWMELRCDFIRLLMKSSLDQIIINTHYECRELEPEMPTREN